MHASKGQNVEIVETLLKLGAGSLLRRASDGRNALHVACEANSAPFLPILRCLLAMVERTLSIALLMMA